MSYFICIFILLAVLLAHIRYNYIYIIKKKKVCCLFRRDSKGLSLRYDSNLGTGLESNALRFEASRERAKSGWNASRSREEKRPREQENPITQLLVGGAFASAKDLASTIANFS